MVFPVDDPGAVSIPPTPAPVVNPGWFKPENVPPGQAATLITVDWLNMTLGELLNAVEMAGLTPSKTNNAQLAQTIATLAWWGKRAIYTTNGIWTCPANVYKVRARDWASGGAGGAGGSASPGGGGGAGAYCEGIFPTVPGLDYAFAFGSPTTFGLSSGSTYLSANPGTDGTAGSGSAVGPGGAGGTVGLNADPNGISINGSNGSNGLFTGSGGMLGGHGGTAFGAPGPAWGASGSGGVNGNPGSLPGGAGSGGIVNYPGGAAGSGLLILEW